MSDNLYFILTSPDDQEVFTITQDDECPSIYTFSCEKRPQIGMTIYDKSMMYQLVNTYHRDGWVVDDKRYIGVDMDTTTTDVDPDSIPF